MNNWNFVNYETIYSSEGTVDVPMESHACFGKIFRDDHLQQKNKYVIHMYKGLQHMEETHGNNAVLVDVDTIFVHLNILKRLFEFNYKLEEKVNQNMHPYFELSFEYDGHRLEHEFMLTWIRYLYEFPYAIFIKDVYELKKFPEYQFINPIMLYNIISSVYDRERDIHSMFKNNVATRLYHYNDIKDRIEARKPHVNGWDDVHKVLNFDGATQRVKDINNTIENPGRDFAFWSKPIEERLPIYNERLILIKNIKLMIFQFLNFHTCYSCAGTVPRELGHDCCFRYITKENPEVEMDNHYHILFHKTTELIEENNYNNFCPFDEKEITKYLNMLRAYCPFTYVLSSETLTFDDDEDKKDEPEYGKTYDVWALDVHITGNLIYHKFILTQIRLLYEHPFNVALMDTKRLRAIEGFSKFTSLNLYSMVISVIGRFSEINALDDQCFCRLGMHSKYIPKFKSLAEYRAKLASQEAITDGGDLGYEQARLFNIHDYAELPQELLIEIQSFVVNTYGYNNRNIIKDLEYWEDPKKFNDRLALYTKVLPYFRK